MVDKEIKTEIDKDIKKPSRLKGWLYGSVTDRDIFWVAVIMAVVAAFAMAILPVLEKMGIHNHCVFYETTGYFCPGCGGTRAAYAFIKGKFLLSFIYHPIVPYGFILGGLYILSHILEMIHVPHIKGMKFREVYVWIGLAIILINWIVKNVILLLYFR
ncbi:MAG: DUF2752 domain-containing protein [Lachnospiraceae bacterium]|nr:DUF2752 domain-containing protein [Lachnospiraceae bacterium]